MKTLRWFVLILFCHTAQAQDNNIWDGETGDIINCEFQYGEADNSNAHSGQWCFKAMPDAYHQPVINLKCSSQWRSDISEKEPICSFTGCDYILSGKSQSSTRIYVVV
jgi:hypothetical protein